MRKYAWEIYDQAQLEKVMEYSQGYKKYISDCKTERECVDHAVALAKANGFYDIN